MEEVINPEESVIVQEGLWFNDGKVVVPIVRSMFDSKMSPIIAGAGEATCQLCTTTLAELKDVDFVWAGYRSTNRTISAAR